MDKKKLILIILCTFFLFLLGIIPLTQASNNSNISIQGCESYNTLNKCTITNYSPYCYENNGYYKLYLYYSTNKSISHTCITKRICENESEDIFFWVNEPINKVELAYVWGKNVQIINNEEVNEKEGNQNIIPFEYLIHVLRQYFFLFVFLLMSLILFFCKKYKKLVYLLLLFLAIFSFMHQHSDYLTTKYVFTVDTYELIDNTKNTMDTSHLFIGNSNPMNAGLYVFLPVLFQIMRADNSNLFTMMKIIPFIFSFIFFLTFYKISNIFIKSKYLAIVISYCVMFIPFIFDHTAIPHRMGYLLWLFPLAFFLLIKSHSKKYYLIPFIILYAVLFISHKTTLILVVAFSLPYILLQSTYVKKSNFNILLFMAIIGWVSYLLYNHPLYLAVNLAVTLALLYSVLPIKKRVSKIIFHPFILFTLIVCFFLLRENYVPKLFHYITIYGVSFSILTTIIIGCYLLALNKSSEPIGFKEIFLALSIPLIILIDISNIPLLGNYPLGNRSRIHLILTIWFLLFLGGAIFKIKQTLEKRSIKLSKIFLFIISIVLLILIVTQFPAIEDQWKYKYNLQGGPYFPEDERLQFTDFLNQTYPSDINVFCIGVHIEGYLEHSIYPDKEIKRFLDPIYNESNNLSIEERGQKNKTFLISYMPEDIEIIVIEKFRYEMLSRYTTFSFMSNYENVYESSLLAVYEKK
jgi:hypothetical protein